MSWLVFIYSKRYHRCTQYKNNITILFVTQLKVGPARINHNNELLCKFQIIIIIENFCSHAENYCYLMYLPVVVIFTYQLFSLVRTRMPNARKAICSVMASQTTTPVNTMTRENLTVLIRNNKLNESLEFPSEDEKVIRNHYFILMSKYTFNVSFTYSIT